MQADTIDGQKPSTADMHIDHEGGGYADDGNRHRDDSSAPETEGELSASDGSQLPAVRQLQFTAMQDTGESQRGIKCDRSQAVAF